MNHLLNLSMNVKEILYISNQQLSLFTTNHANEDERPVFLEGGGWTEGLMKS